MYMVFHLSYYFIVSYLSFPVYNRAYGSSRCISPRSPVGLTLTACPAPNVAAITISIQLPVLNYLTCADFCRATTADGLHIHTTIPTIRYCATFSGPSNACDLLQPWFYICKRSLYLAGVMGCYLLYRWTRCHMPSLRTPRVLYRTVPNVRTF